MSRATGSVVMTGGTSCHLWSSEDRLVTNHGEQWGLNFSPTRNFMVKNRTLLWGFLKVFQAFSREHKIIKHKESLIVDSVPLYLIRNNENLDIFFFTLFGQISLPNLDRFHSFLYISKGNPKCLPGSQVTALISPRGRGNNRGSNAVSPHRRGPRKRPALWTVHSGAFPLG